MRGGDLTSWTSFRTFHRNEAIMPLHSPRIGLRFVLDPGPPELDRSITRA